jgi:ATP-dependent RNA helicase DDX31/DBP7
LARAAFQAQVRAYAAHRASDRQIFDLRHLHLGHVAKALALRETPTAVVGAQTKTVKAAEARRQMRADRALFTQGVRPRKRH